MDIFSLRLAMEEFMSGSLLSGNLREQDASLPRRPPGMCPQCMGTTLEGCQIIIFVIGVLQMDALLFDGDY